MEKRVAPGRTEKLGLGFLCCHRFLLFKIILGVRCGNRTSQIHQASFDLRQIQDAGFADADVYLV